MCGKDYKQEYLVGLIYWAIPGVIPSWVPFQLIIFRAIKMTSIILINQNSIMFFLVNPLNSKILTTLVALVMIILHILYTVAYMNVKLLWSFFTQSSKRCFNGSLTGRGLLRQPLGPVYTGDFYAIFDALSNATVVKLAMKIMNCRLNIRGFQHV